MALPAGGRAVVVCPACVKFNWRDECRRWRPDLAPVVVAGRAGFRPPAAGEVVIVNYDILPDYLDEAESRDGGKAPAPVPDADRAALAEAVLIVDEAHKVKNNRAKRSKRVRSLSRLVKAVWALTGTPLLTRPPDLWGVLESLDMAELAFASFPKFYRLFNAIKGSYGTVWGHPDPAVPEMLRRVMLRRLRTEVLPDLPNKTFTTLVVNGLSDRLRRKLDSLEEEWGGAMEVSRELPPFEEFSAVRAELAASRIDAALEYVEDCEEQDIPLVVASAHRAPIDALADRPGWAVITGDTPAEARQDVVRRFQAGELKGVGLTIAAGGVGLTLTRAWRMLFVDLDWTPANNAQCEDRICRIGQTSDKVEVVRMVSDHPVDRRVLELIAAKIALVEAAVERTVAAVVPGPPPPAPAPEPGETEAEFAARMARAAAEKERAETERLAAARAAEKAAAKALAAGIHAREVARAGAAPAPLTDEVAEAVRRAFGYMLGVCDGAHLRDGQGFNKPDAMVAHRLLTAGLETAEEVEAAYLMLRRYKRQLRDREPALFAA